MTDGVYLMGGMITAQTIAGGMVSLGSIGVLLALWKAITARTEKAEARITVLEAHSMFMEQSQREQTDALATIGTKLGSIETHTAEMHGALRMVACVRGRECSEERPAPAGADGADPRAGITPDTP
jgi:hypothetical protein